MTVENTGVEQVPVAGEQGFTKEDFGYAYGEDLQPVEAAPQPVAEPTPAPEGVPDVKDPEAFAARLAYEKSKIRDEIIQEITPQLQEQFRQQYESQQPDVNTGEIQPLSDDDAERIAAQMGCSEETARVMYMMQAENNRLKNVVNTVLQGSYENESKAEAMRLASEARAKNPLAPEFNEQQVSQFRQAYHKQTGVMLPWKEAYQLHVSQLALSGELLRQTQQSVLQQVVARDKVTAPIQTTQPAQKRTINELSSEEFRRLQEDVDAGKYV